MHLSSLFYFSWQFYLLPIFAIIFFNYFRVYRTVIRFLTGRLVWSMVKASTSSFVLWAIVFNVSSNQIEISDFVRIFVVSILLYWIFAIGLRYLMRALFVQKKNDVEGRERTAIYGLSDSARDYARSLYGNESAKVVLFLTDSEGLDQKESNGIDIRYVDDLPKLLNLYKVQKIIIPKDVLTPDLRKKILDAVLHLPVAIRIVPDYAEMTNSNIKTDYLRPLQVQDVLGRQQTFVDKALINSSVTGKVVLISGAAGSIGSELCKLVMLQNPSKIILVDMAEGQLVELERSLPENILARTEVVLGSVASLGFVDQLFKRFKIDTIFHAAAYKHVDLVQKNAVAGIKNNVFGTYYLGQAATKNDVASFVLISTDKAVQPSNIMGVSKRLCEIIIQQLALSKQLNTRFCVVRFGNVFYSSGSVVPLFEKQVINGGPVTITDSNMTRYFMSIYEAASLIMQSASISSNGEIFLLNMGKPVKVLDIAHTIIRLMGKTIRNEENPSGEVEIRNIGIRKGEKIHEELYYENEELVDTAHPDIFKLLYSAKDSLPKKNLENWIDELRKLLDSGDEEKVRKYVEKIIK